MTRDDLQPVTELTDLDLHLGCFFGRLDGGQGPEVRLAAALASAWTGAGHVCLDLASVAARPLAFPYAGLTVAPDLEAWTAILRASPVVGLPGDWKPLILDGQNRLYLYRYWNDEQAVARFFRNKAGEDLPFERSAVAGLLRALFPPLPGKGISWSAAAVLAALRKPVAVVSGAPGTGKTTVVARILGVLFALAGDGPLRVRLAAPTGKAAVRLQESLLQHREGLPLSASVRQALPEEAATLHRLLGMGAGHPRFSREQPLPAEVVVVDEASMVDLPMMARLVRALPEKGRLILLGDRHQLASVEAGAVLGDLCPDAAMSAFSPSFAEDLRQTQENADLSCGDVQVPALADCLVELQENHRFPAESGIFRISRAIRDGDAASLLSLLESGGTGDAAWLERPPERDFSGAVGAVICEGFAPYLRALAEGRPPEDLLGLFDGFRILCAFRQGPRGVEHLNRLAEERLRRAGLIRAAGPWYPGRPVMVTQNDYRVRLFNGDVGMALPAKTAGGEVQVCFPAKAGQVRWVPFQRLPAHATAFASTVHKSQGSEYDDVLFVLPETDAPLLTRELLYTAVTRARRRVLLWGRPEVLEKAVARRIVRHSGLREGLWGTV